MCTYITSCDKWHRSDNPVTCYKVMFRKKIFGSVYYKSIYFGEKFKKKDCPLKASGPEGGHYPFHISKLNTPAKDIYIITDQGVHAFMDKTDAIDFVKANKDCYNRYGERLVVVECIIPVGALFVIGKDSYSPTRDGAVPAGNEVVCASKMFIKKEICVHI